MTVQEILSNEELRRHEFPVAAERAFLAHAGVCPLPRRVADAIRAYASDSMVNDQELFIIEELVRDTRALAARLIGAQPDEIALVGPTSLALSFIAAGLPLRKNDNVVVYFDDYPSNVYPWMALSERGIQVRFLNIRELGRIRLVDVIGQVDENTRLVALASCHFISGYRIDVRGIGEALRKRKILFSVDGIQTLGASSTSVDGVDFMAADAHKWMLGPCGAGIMYVRRPIQELLAPVAFGWNNVRCPGYVAQEEMTFRGSAQKYEAGTHNILGLVGLRAALQLLLEIGVESIATELRRKREWLTAALAAKGCTVLQASAAAEHSSGITSFFKPNADIAAVGQRLSNAGVVASVRTDRSGQKYIRFSPHFYNTDAELQRAVDAV